MNEENVFRIAPRGENTVQPVAGTDAGILLVAALIASAGPEVAQRAETMLSLMAGTDPALAPHIAQAKRLAIDARRLAEAVAGVTHDAVREPCRAMG